MSNSDETENEVHPSQSKSDMIERYFQLMEQDEDDAKRCDDASLVPDAQSHEFLTTPLFSSSVMQHLVNSHTYSSTTNEYEPFAQYGLLGTASLRNQVGHRALPRPDEACSASEKDLIFTNMNAPWSTFLCGSQGAGKSHTLSCLLENALLSSSPNGNLTQPMTGIVFHYDKFSGFTQTQLCEAVYLCSKVQDVRVLVASTSELRMKRLYGNLPGLPKGSSTPRIMPLYFQERHIDLSNLIQLMAVNENKQGSPLYLEVIFDILRKMVKQNQNRQGISFREFENALLVQDFNTTQRAFLNMRMNLLRSFLDPRVTGDTSVLPPDFDKTWAFPPGSLTIVDLSDPFVTADDACALFSICLSIFMANCHRSAKVVALDEAHKFLTQAGEASKFTEDLLQIIRQQRHLGTRVVIATQEPTLSPKLLELSTISVIHRFTSPAWFNVLKEHLAGVKASDSKNQDLFTEIISLGTGEALIFCPSALVNLVEDAVMPLRDNFMKVRIRKRITTDGGKSIMASDALTETFGSVSLVEQPTPSFGFSTSELQVSDFELSKLGLADSNSNNRGGQHFSPKPKSATGKFARETAGASPDPCSSSSSTLHSLSEQSESASSESGAVIKPPNKVTGSQQVASHAKPTQKKQPKQQPSQSKKSNIAKAPGLQPTSNGKSMPQLKSSQPTKIKATKTPGPEPPSNRQLTPQIQPSQHKRSKTANAPAPEPTPAQISNTFRQVVSAHLIKDSNNSNPSGNFSKWRTQCAEELGLRKDFFSSGQRKKESKETFKQAVGDFYRSRGIALPMEIRRW